MRAGEEAVRERVESDELSLKDFDESVLEFRNHIQNLPGKLGWE